MGEKNELHTYTMSMMGAELLWNKLQIITIVIELQCVEIGVDCGNPFEIYWTLRWQ